MESDNLSNINRKRSAWGHKYASLTSSTTEILGMTSFQSRSTEFEPRTSRLIASTQSQIEIAITISIVRLPIDKEHSYFGIPNTNTRYCTNLTIYLVAGNGVQRNVALINQIPV